MAAPRRPEASLSPPQKLFITFPSPKASKTEVKSYIRALLATYPDPNQHSFDSSAFSSSRKTTGGLSTLPSFRSIRSLSRMTPSDVAICNIWFDGAYLRLLLHVGSLRRELRLLGFEESAARWLDGEIAARYKGLGLKGKGKYWERKMDQESESESGREGGCLRWLFMMC